MNIYIMDDTDVTILLIGKTKRKARDIKRIFAREDNFEKVVEPDKDTYYKIYSLRYPQKSYKVYKSDVTGLFYCDCDFNNRWREYKAGNRRKDARYCVHILSLQVYLTTTKDKT